MFFNWTDGFSGTTGIDCISHINDCKTNRYAFGPFFDFWPIEELHHLHTSGMFRVMGFSNLMSLGSVMIKKSPPRWCWFRQLR